jgi:hypothetical protein
MFGRNKVYRVKKETEHRWNVLRTDGTKAEVGPFEFRRQARAVAQELNLSASGAMFLGKAEDVNDDKHSGASKPSKPETVIVDGIEYETYEQHLLKEKPQ